MVTERDISWSRRRWLTRLAAAGTALPVSRLLTACADGPDAPVDARGMLLSAQDDAEGRHYLAIHDLERDMARRLELPVRGHGAALHPSRPWVVLAGRRPATSLFIVDWRDASLVAEIPSVSRRHFLGHAIFDAEGRWLYATENPFDDASPPDLTPRDSVVGVYDAHDGFRRVREFGTGGVGAHELRLDADGRRLLIANGGIYTHPDYDREELNLDTMDPSLVRVDPFDARVLDQFRLPHAASSIRHFAVGDDGAVAVGMQFRGPYDQLVPLVALLDPGGLRPLELPEETLSGLDQYVGSVAISPTSGNIVATSPRGNRAVFFDPAGRFVGETEITDVCGAGVLDEWFVLSAGTGTITLVDAATLRVADAREVVGAKWDNHLTVAPI